MIKGKSIVNIGLILIFTAVMVTVAVFALKKPMEMEVVGITVNPTLYYKVEMSVNNTTNYTTIFDNFNGLASSNQFEFDGNKIKINTSINADSATFYFRVSNYTTEKYLMATITQTIAGGVITNNPVCDKIIGLAKYNSSTPASGTTYISVNGTSTNHSVNITLQLNDCYPINLNSAVVSFDMTYPNNTIIKSGSNYCVIVGDNIDVKLTVPTGYRPPTITALTHGLTNLFPNLSTYFNAETNILQITNINEQVNITATSSNVYTVTFVNSTGATVSTKDVAYGSTYGTLPTVTRSGYSLSWGTKNLINESAITLYENSTHAWYEGPANGGTNKYTFTKLSNGCSIYYHTYINQNDFVPRIFVYGLETNTDYYINFTVSGWTDLFHRNYLYPIDLWNNPALTIGSNDMTFNTGSNTKVCIGIYLRSNVSSNVSKEITFTNFQLERGTSATAYEMNSYTTSSTVMNKTYNHTLYAHWAPI